MCCCYCESVFSRKRSRSTAAEHVFVSSGLPSNEKLARGSGKTSIVFGRSCTPRTGPPPPHFTVHESVLLFCDFNSNISGHSRPFLSQRRVSAGNAGGPSEHSYARPGPAKHPWHLRRAPKVAGAGPSTSRCIPGTESLQYCCMSKPIEIALKCDSPAFVFWGTCFDANTHH